MTYQQSIPIGQEMMARGDLARKLPLHITC